MLRQHVPALFFWTFVIGVRRHERTTSVCIPLPSLIPPATTCLPHTLSPPTTPTTLPYLPFSLPCLPPPSPPPSHPLLLPSHACLPSFPHLPTPYTTHLLPTLACPTTHYHHHTPFHHLLPHTAHTALCLPPLPPCPTLAFPTPPYYPTTTYPSHFLIHGRTRQARQNGGSETYYLCS